MKFKNLTIGCGAALAPMAGFTDASCRALAAQHGAVFTVSEMVSAKALTFGDKKSRRLLACGKNNAPYGVQLFGAEPETMGRAAALIANEQFDFFDINMGCPAPKITGSGAGSRLMTDPVLAGEIVKEVVRNADERPVTVKMRLGWDQEHINAAEVALRCREAGAAAIAIHGRTREEMYRPGIHPEEIAKVKQMLDIPVLANGDIATAEDALRLKQQTGCDGVLVGRGALGNPWLFEQIAAAFEGRPIPKAPGLAARLRTMRAQIEAMCEEKGEWVAMPQARSHAMYYLTGLRGAAGFRNRCSSLEHFDDVDRLIEAVLRENPILAAEDSASAQ